MAYIGYGKYHTLYTNIQDGTVEWVTAPKDKRLKSSTHGLS